ncbi:MAG: UDP-N-acetylglucosamine 1-carboxyvinyltransferase [Flavobacteriaceae bacterium]
MGSFVIEGGHVLRGEVTPQGAKNEALQIICAVLLTPEKVTIHNVPQIIDVIRLIDILRQMGVKVEQLSAHSYTFDSSQVDPEFLHTEAFKREAAGLRGSIMLVGPMLARFGKGYIPKPGGDKIGRRRLDTHFEGFIRLGARFRYNDEESFYGVEADRLKGCYMLLDEASVTGTANIIMAAVLAEGETTIYNAACEPYIQQLCALLIAMGARISGVGSNLLRIEGVERLGAASHTLLSDMIEVGSWIGLAAITRSEIRIKNVGWEHLGQLTRVYERLGIQLIRDGEDMLVPAHKDGYTIQSFIDGSLMTISDAPWPGLTPDILSVLLVVVTQANGSVLIHQKMFESRLFFVDKLIDMGAQIILCDPHRATVIGQNFETPLRASKLSSPDIRAGMALLIAALSAKGTSVIHNIEQIDRGYQFIEQRLSALGAVIERRD